MAVASRPAQAPAQVPAQSHAEVAVRPSRGSLVALEGIDGSGKSTLARHLHARLAERGVDAVLTREPTDSWLGQTVKRAIRESNDPFVEAFLFLADHADHVRQVEQWLAMGKVVVSDRYGDSCIAYQAAALEPMLRQRGVHAFDWLMATQAPVDRPPEVCLLLDLEPPRALGRIAGRPEFIKFEEAEFLTRVRSNYLRLARGRGYFEVLDAGQSPDKLLEQAWAALVRRRVAPP